MDNNNNNKEEQVTAHEGLQLQSKDQQQNNQNVNNSMLNVSIEAAQGIGNCSFDQFIGVTSMEMNMFDECPHSSEKKKIELEFPSSAAAQNQDISSTEGDNIKEWAQQRNSDDEGEEAEPESQNNDDKDADVVDKSPSQNDKSPSQNQEGILNLNSDIFEYCCFNGSAGDDILMMYPAQNHFIEEYNPDDQYEIQEHNVSASSPHNNHATEKSDEENNSPQSSNMVAQMSNLNLSGCATTDLSHKSTKNAQPKGSFHPSGQASYKMMEQQNEPSNIQFNSAKNKSGHENQQYNLAPNYPTNQQQQYEANNLQVFYGTGQQISMFDQFTENEAEIEDSKAVIQTLQVPPSQAGCYPYNFNFGSDGMMGLGQHQQLYGQQSVGNFALENFDGIDEFELLTGAIMFDGQFGPKKIKNTAKKPIKLSKLQQKYHLGLQKRIHTDPGYQCGGIGLGESDVDIGEDMGEEGPGPSNLYRANKHFRNLHKYRERIQVLNEDLNVLIFDGEEDFDLISEQILSKQKLIDQHSSTSNNIESMQVKEQRVAAREGDDEDGDSASPLKDVENWNEDCALDSKKTVGQGKTADQLPVAPDDAATKVANIEKTDHDNKEQQN